MNQRAVLQSFILAFIGLVAYYVVTPQCFNVNEEMVCIRSPLFLDNYRVEFMNAFVYPEECKNTRDVWVMIDAYGLMDGFYPDGYISHTRLGGSLLGWSNTNRCSSNSSSGDVDWREWPHEQYNYSRTESEYEYIRDLCQYAYRLALWDYAADMVCLRDESRIPCTCKSTEIIIEMDCCIAMAVLNETEYLCVPTNENAEFKPLDKNTRDFLLRLWDISLFDVAALDIPDNISKLHAKDFLEHVRSKTEWYAADIYKYSHTFERKEIIIVGSITYHFLYGARFAGSQGYKKISLRSLFPDESNFN